MLFIFNFMSVFHFSVTYSTILATLVPPLTMKTQIQNMEHRNTGSPDDVQ